MYDFKSEYLKTRKKHQRKKKIEETLKWKRFYQSEYDFEKVIIVKQSNMRILTDLSETVNDINSKNGFWDDFEKAKEYHERERSDFSLAVVTAFINQSLVLIATEVSEGVEALRKGRDATNEGVAKVLEQKEGTPEWIETFENEVKDTFEDELADTIIRVLDLAGGLGIDIGWHVRNKIMYNSQREPKHGKKF